MLSPILKRDIGFWSRFGLNDLYGDAIKTSRQDIRAAPPSWHPYLPQPYTLIIPPRFEDVDGCMFWKPISPQPLLVRSVHTCLHDRKLSLSNTMAATLAFLDIKLPRQSFSDESTFSNLDLAISVFRHIPCNRERKSLRGGTHALVGYPHQVGLTLVGWDYAGPNRFHDIGYLESPSAGVKMAWLLVDLAGLDPLTATAKEMDKADLRLICGLCPMHGSRGKPVYTWREGVSLCMFIQRSIADVVLLRWRTTSSITLSNKKCMY